MYGRTLVYDLVALDGIGPGRYFGSEVDGLGSDVDVERVLVAGLEGVGAGSRGVENICQRGIALERLGADVVFHVNASLGKLRERGRCSSGFLYALRNDELFQQVVVVVVGGPTSECWSLRRVQALPHCRFCGHSRSQVPMHHP